MPCKKCVLWIALLVFFLAKTNGWLITDCPKSSRAGVGLHYIQNSQMTSSSHLPSHQAKHGRLFGKSAWCPGPSVSDRRVPEADAWLQVDLKEIHFFCAVLVQGAPDEDKWVQMYRISHSKDGKKWTKESYYSTGNTDRGTVKESRPYIPHLARYIRFTPARSRYNKWPCMRVEIIAKKPFNTQPNIIIWRPRHTMFVLYKPNGKENHDGSGNVKGIYLDQITKTPDNEQSAYLHYLSDNKEIYPDIPPQASNLFSGIELLIVLPNNKYMKAEIVGLLGNNLYEVRRSDNGKTEVFRKDYFRQKGLDACELDTQCPDISKCVLDELNRPGRYHCRCNSGYKVAKSIHMTSRCEDDNECRNAAENCPSKSVCTNTIGSYNCTCTQGYKKTKHNECGDVNECKATPSPCGNGFSCHNFPGSFKCRDVDECATTPCFEGEVCVNTHGSFRCEMPERKDEEDTDDTKYFNGASVPTWSHLVPIHPSNGYTPISQFFCVLELPQSVTDTPYVQNGPIYTKNESRPSVENVMNSSYKICCHWPPVVLILYRLILRF